MENILRGNTSRDNFPANFIHNEEILRTMANNPLYMPIYLLLRNRVIYNVENSAVSELKAEDISKILNISVENVKSALLGMEEDGWIQVIHGGYSVGNVSMVNNSPRIYYYYATVASGKDLGKQVLTFKNKFRESYLNYFKSMYRGNGYTTRDTKQIEQVIATLRRLSLPVDGYIDFVFSVVIPYWEKNKGVVKSFALKSMCSMNLMRWYEEHLTRRKGGTPRGSHSVTKVDINENKDKIKYVNGTSEGGYTL